MPNADSNRKPFREFPLAFRIAQRSFLFAVLIPIVLRFMIRAKVGGIPVAVMAASGLCVLTGIIATHLVLIRYPYIGMIDPADGDPYAKYVEAISLPIRKILKVIGIAAGTLAIAVPFLDGNIKPIEMVWLLYAGALLMFILFLAFRYDRLEHPAVATFLRCTLGLGVFLCPIFLPALIIGSMRAQRILDDAEVQLEAEKRQSRN
ncbi:MAG: hypothetical protein ACK5PZ_07515 [Pirellula sp.]|jgi:hypothetical protein